MSALQTIQTSSQGLGNTFVEHRKYLRSLARKITGSAETADDVLQDAYLKLMQGACARDVANPLGYCCQVVRSVAFDYHRRQSVESTYREYCVDGELPPIPCNTAIDRNLHERRVLDAVAAVVEALPPRIRQVFEMYRLGGLTQREIGKQLQCSATLVNFMLKEAMEALSGCRALLEDE
jgi:RNA polymerase sigma-70 factor (ECF subfamily)